MTSAKTLLRCSQCSKEFKYDSERKRHEQSHIPQFACKVCSKTFSFISALRRHEKQHERTGKATCDLCDKAFKDHVLLKRHVKYAHEGLHTCSKCDSVFNSEPALRTHLRTHKAESERRYQCSFEGCSKKFNFAHHLKHHELTHTNTKQYFCKICAKGFIQSHHLKTHLKTHSVDYSLHCTFPDCNKKFATEYAKKRHEAKHDVKMDSGISSDSNSAADTSIPTILKDTDVNDSIQLHKLNLESQSTDSSSYTFADSYNKLANEYVEENYSHKYNENISPLEEMISKTEREDHNMLIDYNKFIEHIPEDLSIKNNNNNESSEKYSLRIRKSEMNDCKSAVGGCIMKEQNENCVCAQISDTINDDYDFTPIGTALKLTDSNLNSNDTRRSKCCGSNRSITNDEMPEFEFKIDGTVKIKEFIDIDIATEYGLKSDNKIKCDVNSVPYNSCKAILGNCIVSGNGTIGDGCLCAKMIIDDQVTAEEIEDITPYPNSRLVI
ncbi:unnamed protein product [Arctia plantaginis]|uniref:C2H2-type domain-containing protein n=1 Tax=Arctia plantaginis TaxID=874455 RepID=A0A8S1AHE6_ARCPL|nr:unnamed protein product [Arctia plantaginis]